MNQDLYYYIFFFTCVIPLLIAISMVCILRFTLDRKVRGKLSQKNDYSSGLDAYFGLGRAIAFGYACAFNYYNDSSKIRENYENIDVRKLASPLERAFGIIFSYSVVLVSVSLAFALIIRFLGLVDIQT